MGRGHCRASSFFSPPAVMPVDTTCVCVAGQGPRPMAELSRGVRLSLSLSLSLLTFIKWPARERGTQSLLYLAVRVRALSNGSWSATSSAAASGVGRARPATCYIMYPPSGEHNAEYTTLFGLFGLIWRARLLPRLHSVGRLCPMGEWSSFCAVPLPLARQRPGSTHFLRGGFMH